MLWHYEIATRDGLPDPAGHEVDKELAWLGLAEAGPVRTSRLYLLGGELDRHAAEQLAAELLCDAVVQSCTLSERSQTIETAAGAVTVCRRAGVMDPVEESLRRGAARLGHELALVRTGLCHRFGGRVTAQDLGRIAESLLANPVIDEIHLASAALPVPRPAAEQDFELILVELGNDDELMALSREKGLSLNLEEMRIIRDHFQELGRLPTDIELETLAQTWSEHCKHKTFTASVEMDGRSYQNLLKETVFAATRELDRDWCVSVFSDNAGIIRFDDDHDLCIKVETHNHPSAIEPYGGAGTGLGGVIRDILGTGLGGKPVANLDVFCVGEPDARDEDLPAGVTHPLRILKGIVAGVRDYGNRMGIPTVAGAVLFDERYTGNPLVYAGTVGLIPHEFAHKEARPGDHIVVLGGRTGRDGIHGATFSSRELHEDSETLDGGAVQIGNAITEKRMMDVLLLARDRKLYSCLTDCGAGGFSSAVGEIAETTGARVDLGAAPLKYPGLSYREIWLSEAQERMVLTVPPRHLAELLELCASEDVETCVLGEITDTGHLEIAFHGEPVADLAMSFLHDGLPKPRLKADWKPPAPEPDDAIGTTKSPTQALRAILGDPNVASKEWIIRQYDHEVQSTSCLKPLVGVHASGPGDAAVHAPVLGSTKGFALGLGINPRFADLDPHAASMAAIDEALRNVVAVGGDPERTCILDNFSWGNTQKSDRLGALVLAAEGCRDASLALGLPFVSGKDSLNNEYATSDGTICIPHTLLVTALALVDDVRQSVSMDLKQEGSLLFLIGSTADERGGSSWARAHGRLGSRVPAFDAQRALAHHRAVHAAIRRGLVRSCHDLSEGGLAVAAAEMAFSGGLGSRIELSKMILRDPTVDDAGRLFSESLTRWLVEVAPADHAAFSTLMAGVDCALIGEVIAGPRLEIRGHDGDTVIDEDIDALRRIFETGLSSMLEGERRG